MLPRQARHGYAAYLMANESRKTIDEVAERVRIEPVPAAQVVAGVGHVKRPLFPEDVPVIRERVVANRSVVP